MENSNRWEFVKDMNHDGVFTISDIFLWITWVFFLPGDKIIDLLISSFPDFSQFMEISSKDYGGFFSGLISFSIWLAGIYILVMINNYYSNIPSHEERQSRWHNENDN